MQPKVFAAETIDEYAVAVGLRLGDPAAEWLPVFRPSGSLLPPPPFLTAPLRLSLADERLFPTNRRNPVARRWRETRGDGGQKRFEPMSWALQLSRPEPLPEEGLGAEVDGWMRQLAILAPEERPSFLAEVIHAASPTGFLAGIGDSPWALPAMLHAALTGRPFLWFDRDEDLIAASRSEVRSMTICAPLPLLTLPLLDEISAARSFAIAIPRLAHVSFCARPVSFLTARTVEILSHLVVKHHLYRQSDLSRTAWLFLLSGPPKETDPEVTLLTRAQADAAHLRTLPPETDLLMAYGHSREDIFYVGTDLICGASNEGGGAAAGALLPACALEGRCIKGGERIAVWSLPVKALFVNGCSTLRLGGGNFSPEYTLGFSFLEGTGSLFVASSRTHYGNLHENLLQYHLLRAGLSVNESVRLVNNTLPMGGAEVPNYLVLGEGDWQPLRSRPNGVHLEVAPEAGGWRIDCTEVDAQYVEVWLPQLPAEPCVRTTHAGAPVELFHAVAPEPGGGARLFVFGWQRLRLAWLSIRVRFEPPADEQVAALRIAHQNLVYSRLYRSYSPKLRNLENEMMSLSTFIARQLGEARHSPSAAARVEEKAQQVEDVISRMNGLICEHLLSRVATSAFVLTDQYMETDGSFQVAEHLPSDTVCPYCANRILRRVIRHQISPAVRREIDLCVVCGNVWDVPQGGLRPEYRNAAVLARNAAHPLEVVLRNTTGRRARGWLGFRLYQAEAFGVEIDPPMVEVTLVADEVIAIPFSLRLGTRVPTHMEWLKGFWVSDLDICYFQRNLWITPEIVPK